jgi:lambda family phage portal protein
MGWLDRFRRKQPPPARAARRIKRQYAAAVQDRLLAGFSTLAVSADSDIRVALRVLRARSRDLAKNDDYARRYLHLLKANVVGSHGIKLQSRAVNLDGALDTPANDQIERAWRKWGKKGNCTADGRLSWVGVQKLAIESLARDGEVLIQKLVRPTSEFGFVLHFIDPERLDAEFNGGLRSGNRVRMGVEVDRDDRPVAYWLLDAHPADAQFSATAQPQKRTRIPADQIIHLYDQTETEQSRGVPWLHTAMKRLHHLNGYEEAELVAARVAASKMGFFKPDEESGNAFEGETIDTDGAIITEAKPGTFEELPPGMEFSAFDPTHPTTAYSDFVKGVLRGAASGLNVSYTALSNNLEGVSFSSIRQGNLDDRDQWRMLQTFLIEHMIEDVFGAWLPMQITAGTLKLPARKLQKFLDGAIWAPRGWQWVDPLKEMNANVAGVKNGMLTLQDVASETGRDVDEMFAQFAREKELAAKHGIEISFEPFGAKDAQPMAPASEPASEPERAET